MSRKIVEYTVIRGDTSFILSANVMAAIDNGFEPQGGVAIVTGGLWAQAVVRYKNQNTFPKIRSQPEPGLT